MIDFFRYHPGAFQKQVRTAVDRVVRRGQFILGPELRHFEEQFATYTGARHAIGMNSGTDALFLALKALQVGPGDEVITVANTATPTVSAIRMTGANPVFVDVDARTHTIDVALIERAITKRTRVILPVHLYGYPADMRPIMQLARRHKLKVVEDAAQAHGATDDGRMVGTIGDIGCFSFYPTKNLGAIGDAGCAVTNNERLAAELTQLRNYGETAKYQNRIEGVNSRLDEMQAAVLNEALPCLNEWNAKRAKLAQLYLRLLADAEVELPADSDVQRERVWHLFVIETARRDKLQRHLTEHGIQTAIHYPRPIYAQPAYRVLKPQAANLPVTAKLSRRILSLPLYPEMTERDVRQICRVIRDVAPRRGVQAGKFKLKSELKSR